MLIETQASKDSIAAKGEKGLHSTRTREKSEAPKRRSSEAQGTEGERAGSTDSASARLDGQVEGAV